MIGPIIKLLASAATIFGLASGQTAIEPDAAVDLFWAIHEAMPDLVRVEQLLKERAFLGGISSDTDSTKTLNMYLSDSSVSVLADLTEIDALGSQAGYTVTFSDASLDTAIRVQDLLSARLDGRASGPLPEQYQTEGWDSVARPGEEGSAQLIYSVGHSQSDKLTNIWGSQLHVKEE
jgi:hypothetical protein